MARDKNSRMKILTVNLPVRFLKLIANHENFNCASKSEFIRLAVKNQIMKELKLEDAMKEYSTETMNLINQVKNVPIMNGRKPYIKKKKKPTLGNIYYPSYWEGEDIIPQERRLD